MGKQISRWVWILERVTEHGSAGKYKREKSWKSKSPYTYDLIYICYKLYSTCISTASRLILINQVRLEKPQIRAICIYMGCTKVTIDY